MNIKPDDCLPQGATTSHHGLVAIPLYDNEGTPGAPDYKNGYIQRAQQEPPPSMPCRGRRIGYLHSKIIGRVCGPYVVVRAVGSDEATSAFYILRCPFCGHEVTRSRRNLMSTGTKACGRCQGTGVPTAVKGRFVPNKTTTLEQVCSKHLNRLGNETRKEVVVNPTRKTSVLFILTPDEQAVLVNQTDRTGLLLVAQEYFGRTR